MSVSPITAHPPSAAASVGTPTSIRYTVLAWACSLSTLTYLDRVLISKVQRPMMADLGLSSTDMGWILWAFFVSYSIFEVPSGWLGDRIGPRRVLFRIVVWWSIFTMLTGLVFPFRLEIGGLVFGSFALLLAVRFLFGVGEAGAYPNAAKLLRNWFPYGQRGFAQGLMWAFARFGGAAAPVLIVLIGQHLGWRGIFATFGLVGAVWAILFRRTMRDTPAEDLRTNDAERRLIDAGAPTSQRLPISWSTMLSSSTLWLLAGMYFFINAGWSFFITWDQPYYEDVLKLSGIGLTLATTGPLFCGGIACLLGGFSTDAMVRILGRRWGRTLQGMLAYAFGAAFFAAALFVRDPVWSVVLLCTASFSKDLAMSVTWATCLDVGHRYSGSVSGFMNMIGNFGAATASLLVPYLAYWTGGGWQAALVVSAISLGIVPIAWFFIDPTRTIVYAPADQLRLIEDGEL
jgi:sugar phosphate permease